jgi:hypothetical protein
MGRWARCGGVQAEAGAQVCQQKLFKVRKAPLCLRSLMHNAEAKALGTHMLAPQPSQPHMAASGGAAAPAPSTHLLIDHDIHSHHLAIHFLGQAHKRVAVCLGQCETGRRASLQLLERDGCRQKGRE